MTVYDFVIVGAGSAGCVLAAALRSDDPRSAPVIDPAYLSEPSDLELLVAGVRTAREIVDCRPFAGHTAGERIPGPHVDDDQAIREWIRTGVGTAYHPLCSCAMGGSDDAVCDPTYVFAASTGCTWSTPR